MEKAQHLFSILLNIYYYEQLFFNSIKSFSQQMYIYTFQGHHSSQYNQQLLGINGILSGEKSVISLMGTDLLSTMIANTVEGDQRGC